MTITNFSPGLILYAANLNTAFANTVNIAGDTMTGPLIVPLFHTNGGMSYANNGLTINGANVEAYLRSTANVAQGAFDKANTGTSSTTTHTFVAGQGLTVNNGISVALTGNATAVFAANSATTSTVGVVQLNDTFTSTSTTQASTANVANTIWNHVKASFDKANTGGGAIAQQTFLTSNGIIANNGTVLTVVGNNTVLLSANLASTSSPGVIQLNDTVLSTSSSLGATANAVNTVWSYAQTAFTTANVAIGQTLTFISSNSTVNGATTFTVSGNATVLLSPNTASTTRSGIVQLDDQLGASFSPNTAPTTNALSTAWVSIQAAFNRANTASGGANNIVNQTFIAGYALTVNNGITLSVSGNNSVLFAANAASTTAPGAVQLNDTFTSVATNQAATPNVANTIWNHAKAAFQRANTSTLTTTYIAGQSLTVNNGTSLTLTGNGTIVFASNIGTTSVPGVIQLNDTVTSNFANQAATANIANTIWTTAKAAFDKANLTGPGITTTYLTTNGLTVNTGTVLSVTGNASVVLSANNASTTGTGVVQLNDTFTSTATNQAVTPNVANTIWNHTKAAFATANSFAGGITTTYQAFNGVTVNNGSSLVISGSGTIVVRGANATTGGTGVVQLNDTVTSTSTSLAATANSVNAVHLFVSTAVQNTANIMVASRFNVPDSITVSGNAVFGNVIFTNNTFGFGQTNSRGIMSRQSFSPGFITSPGDVQTATHVLYVYSTTTGNFILTTDGQNPRGSPYGRINQIAIPSNSVYMVSGIIGGKDTNNNTKVWDIKAVIKRGIAAGTTALVSGGLVINTLASDDPTTSGWGLTVQANTTDGMIQFQVSGSANTKWTGRFDTIEIA